MEHDFALQGQVWWDCQFPFCSPTSDFVVRWAQGADGGHAVFLLPGLHKWQVLVLSDRDHLIEVSKDGINVKDSYGGVVIDKEFGR